MLQGGKREQLEKRLGWGGEFMWGVCMLQSVAGTQMQAEDAAGPKLVGWVEPFVADTGLAED